MNYKIIETDQQVEGTGPEFVTRSRWRARRRCRDLNEKRKVAFYRYEIQQVDNKWEVIVMQNKVEPLR